jgi:hypothetical protein
MGALIQETHLGGSGPEKEQLAGDMVRKATSGKGRGAESAQQEKLIGPDKRTHTVAVRIPQHSRSFHRWHRLQVRHTGA